MKLWYRSFVYDRALLLNCLQYIVVKTVESNSKNKQLNMSSVKMYNVLYWIIRILFYVTM